MAKLLGHSICHCPHDCSGSWSRAAIVDLRNSTLELVNDRKHFMTFLMTLLETMWNAEAREFSFMVLGHNVCRVAFREFWHLTKYGLDLLCRCIRERRDYPTHGNALLFQDNPAARLCSIYLQRLADVSEQQPDTEEIHLVERTTKISVYEGMVAELSPLEDPDDIPSYPTFTRTWRQKFPHLKIPKECRLGRCDDCDDLSEKIKTSRGQRRQRYQQEKRTHNNTVKVERLEMEAKLKRAQTHPDDWTCLATDWCNPHQMPHKSRTPKTWFTKRRLKYHVFGICNYATNERILFPHFEHWTHDANLHISFLYCYLRELKEKGLLRKNLMLQMDNCWRDNKNKWFFGFMAKLVDMNWFHSVEIYYLSPGHSHAMVDRECFKPLGRHARALYSYWTPDEFWTNFVSRAFRRTLKRLSTLAYVAVWDWKDWMEPYLRNMRWHSFQRAFLIHKEDNKVQLRFKASILRADWRGLKNAPENGLEILRDIPENEIPTVIAPTPLLDEEFDDLFTLSNMPSHIQTFWETFKNDQFDENFGIPPAEWEDDFWLAEDSSVSSERSSTASTEEDLENLEERNIHVAHHPRTIPLIELQRGTIIAVRPRESYYEENPDETRENFWLAKIIRIKTPKIHRRQTVHRYLVAWFHNENVDVENSPSKYILDPNFTNVINYDSILLHNIDLTLQKALRSADFRKINLQLAV